MLPLLWTDHRPRIEFYVRAGMLPQAPTDEQLGQAFLAIKTKVGVLGQIKYYSRHPLMMLPTARKRAVVRRNVAEIARDGHLSPHLVAKDTVLADTTAEPLLDRFLERLFLFSPARFAAQCVFNPWAAVPASGLNVPRQYLIAHIMHTTHPPPAMWDMQVLHPDPGGLDELEARLERAMSRRGLQSRIDRALGCREGYFEYLREWLPRIRKFDYPEIPRGYTAIGENLVEFLRYAAAL